MFPDRIDDRRRSWYSTQLCAMGETPLGKPSIGNTRIRFLWLRSFDPGIAVRVEHTAKGANLIAIELNGAGGGTAGAVARRMERPLAVEEWTTLQELIADSDFWNLQTFERNKGRDGANWIIEVSVHDRYHIVDRWSGGALEQLGLYILALSRLELDPVY